MLSFIALQSKILNNDLSAKCDPVLPFTHFGFVVQLLSYIFATLWTVAHQAFLSFNISQFAQTHVHWVGDAIQPSHPLLSPSPPAFSISQHQGLFQWVSSSHQVAKVLEFQLQHQSFSEYSGLISFRMDWFDLLAAKGTLKSLLQHHSSKASVLWLSAFFIVQLSYPYMTTGKTIVWLDGLL